MKIFPDSLIKKNNINHLPSLQWQLYGITITKPEKKTVSNNNKKAVVVVNQNVFLQKKKIETDFRNYVGENKTLEDVSKTECFMLVKGKEFCKNKSNDVTQLIIVKYTSL